ncbi:MAG: glucose 1-dehydrogenase [Deltaproteobacteria bacterium]|nr:glucose 1-dehydrogenase [Deltaproteobacteria bacterium]
MTAKKNYFDLTGKVAVVTGASRGLGRSMALGLAHAGAAVVLASRGKEALDAVAAEVRADGAEALVVPADLGTNEGNDRLAEAALGWKQQVDILVNNAGYSSSVRFLESTDEEWRRIFDINLFGIVRLTRSIGKHMTARKQGSVIMIGSVLGRTAMSGASPYCVTKGAIEQFTRVLGTEWAKFNVRVNCIAPAYFDTELASEARNAEKTYDYIVRRTPMRRFGNADEIISSALYLASDASSYVTGSIVHVDGGWTAA